ncbi:glycoside hydrolase [Gramella sp. BOM4]|nr:glycoside hydrolase [Christiangramia bathymodioli]
MKRPGFYINSLILIIFSALCSCQAEFPKRKINGISLVASRDSLRTDHLEPIKKTYANAVALMPYAFMRDKENPELIFNIDRQWFGEREEGIEHSVALLKKANLRLMMKPHIWLRNGEFTGDLSFDSEDDWKTFENSYRDYILLYAGIAEKHHFELLCIGTELFNFVDQRPEFWKSLISEIRKNYHGKLVYAENWDKVNQTNIWQHLDFIGVDAYFPLSQAEAPTEAEIVEGWEIHKEMLEELSSEHDLPVLFTEYGYRSVDHALKEPWNSSRDSIQLNHNLQARALKVLYEEIWPEYWFAGGFLWKWHQDLEVGGLYDSQFTPQNKPAEKVVSEYYRRFRN